MHIHDQAVKSSLMETYSIHLDRQQKAIQHMAQLYQQALDQLALIEASSNQG
ncbi:hypothetical protein [Spirosoma liriopis]|uniref:hypothetical protein n=1 Tax=Spirosoma liriopis TaxID=2937440 RepID=UPI0020BD65F2|nr:hypothetical protein [Spirosoma liriopis]